MRADGFWVLDDSGCMVQVVGAIRDRQHPGTYADEVKAHVLSGGYPPPGRRLMQRLVALADGTATIASDEQP